MRANFISFLFMDMVPINPTKILKCKGILSNMSRDKDHWRQVFLQVLLGREEMWKLFILSRELTRPRYVNQDINHRLPTGVSGRDITVPIFFRSTDRLWPSISITLLDLMSPSSDHVQI